MSSKAFEDLRWEHQDQPVEFWHLSALQNIKDGEHLDVGCGIGLLMRLLKERGIKTVGVDVSSSGLQKAAASGLEIREVDLEAGVLPFADSSFKHVTCLEVLEHLHHPEKVIAECRRVSKEFVYLSVPNFNSLSARLQVLFGKRPENNTPGKGHVYWFNKSIFEKHILNSGLVIESHSALGYWSKKSKPFQIVGEWLAKIYPSAFGLSFFYVTKKS